MTTRSNQTFGEYLDDVALTVTISVLDTLKLAFVVFLIVGAL